MCARVAGTDQVDRHLHAHGVIIGRLSGRPAAFPLHGSQALPWGTHPQAT